MDQSNERLRPPAWARAADVVSVGLVLLAVAVWLVGGGVLHLGVVRISLRSAWRVALWAAALIAVRHVLFRPRPLHRRLRDGVREAVRPRYQLPRDDVFPRASDPVTGPGRMIAWTLGVLVVFWALTFAMTYPQLKVLDQGVTLDFGDPLFSTWRLSWVAHQLPRDPWHLFDANIFHPAKGTLAFSDAMIVPALTAAPLLWLGMHQVLVTNLMLLSGFALSGAAMFLLVRSLTQHVGAALIAGFVFAFLPYRFMHYAHLELQMAQWMPLCLWALHRAVNGGRWRDGLLTGLFLALQTLSSFYYGIFFATYLIPVGVALLLGAAPARRWPAVRSLAAGAVLAAVLVAPVTRPYFTARQSVGERPLGEVDFYSAVPRDYLVAHTRNVMYGRLSRGYGAQERELFQGFAVPVIAAAALWPPLSAARVGYCAGMAIAFDLSLGTNGLLYPWMREYFLPFRGLRVPARMAILVGLSLAILVGYAVARISRAGSSRSARAAAVIVLGALVVSEYRSTLLLKNMWRWPPPVYASLQNHPDAVLVELPLVEPDIALEPVFMYFSTFHWHRLVNGYSGFSPPSYAQLLRTMKTFPDEASVAELRRREVDYVIVHGAFFTSPDTYTTLVDRMDRRADLHLETVTRWYGRDTRLYRLDR